MKEKKYLEIGNRLKILRGLLSQTQMANQFNLHLRAYQYYESGERMPPTVVCAAIAKKYNKTVDWILTGESSLDETMSMIVAEAGNKYEAFNKNIIAAKAIPPIQELIRDLMDIMESNDDGTRVAIAQNIKMFKESVKRKIKLDAGKTHGNNDFKTQGTPGEKKRGGGNGE